ncbi:MAG: histidinol-phosphate aminotransferase [Acidimicrobiia bacterium]|nr:histidinol-phosphate aminotransferase [Acidimicrobiia bacterium]
MSRRQGDSNSASVPPDIFDVAPQGGDPRHLPASVQVDLSTCVSRYGPPPSALAALRDASATLLRSHPYGASEQLTEAYGRFLGVPAHELVAGRGASELIWLLAGSPLAPRVAVPVPAYTEYRQAFPRAAAGEAAVHHRLELVSDLLEADRVVLISNPHNPSGRAFTAAELGQALMAARGRGVLVVDESYVEFVNVPGEYSMIGQAFENLLVVRSPSKFFGVAGARVGVAWSPNPALRAALTVRRGSWPVSGLEVAPVAAALGDRCWQAESHAALQADSAWLAQQLVAIWGSDAAGGAVIDGAVTHFRLVSGEAAGLAPRLATAGIAVRTLGRGHGLELPAVRIAAPRVEERALVAAALAAVADGSSR